MLAGGSKARRGVPQGVWISCGLNLFVQQQPATSLRYYCFYVNLMPRLFVSSLIARHRTVRHNSSAHTQKERNNKKIMQPFFYIFTFHGYAVPSGPVLLSHEPGGLVHRLSRRLRRHQRVVPHPARQEGDTNQARRQQSLRTKRVGSGRVCCCVVLGRFPLSSVMLHNCKRCRSGCLLLGGWVYSFQTIPSRKRTKSSRRLVVRDQTLVECSTRRCMCVLCGLLKVSVS